MNQDAVVEQVSKGIVTPNMLKALKLPLPQPKESSPLVVQGGPIPFTTEAEYQKAIDRRLAAVDTEKMVQEAVQTQWRKMLGRV